MTESIIIAILSLFGTLTGSYAGIKASNRLVVYRLEQLEDKVNKHNNLVDRTYKLEEKQCLQEEQIKVTNHRISKLEKER